MFVFLSAEWLAAATDSLAGVRSATGACACIGFEIVGQPRRSCVLQVRDGTITLSPEDRSRDRDVTLRCRLDDVFAVLSGASPGDDAVATSTMNRVGAGAEFEPLPPFSLTRQVALERLLSLPGADLSVHMTLNRGPLGRFECCSQFRDGKLADVVPGLVGEPDVALETTFGRLMRLYRAEISWQELLRDSRLRTGSLEALLFLAGIIESPAWREATSACASGPAPVALAGLGELLTQADYRSAIREVLSETVEPAHAESRLGADA